MAARNDKPLSEIPTEKLNDLLQFPQKLSRQRRVEIGEELRERALGRRPSPSGTSYSARKRLKLLSIVLVSGALALVMILSIIYPAHSQRHLDNEVYAIYVNNVFKGNESGRMLNAEDDFRSEMGKVAVLIVSLMFVAGSSLGLLQNSWIGKHWRSKSAPMTTLGLK